jgi:hypothetical protein
MMLKFRTFSGGNCVMSIVISSALFFRCPVHVWKKVLPAAALGRQCRQNGAACL